MPERRLRAATLNIWGRHGDWPRRRELLRSGFAALQPDLVALQETVLTDEYDQAADLLDAGYHVIHQSQRAEDGTGCSIASRLPPVRVDEIDLCVTERVDPADFVGRSTAAQFDTPVGRVIFMNHKPSWRLPLEHERELQAVRAARFLEELADEADHVVVAGDCDARPETASMRFWTGRQSLDGLSVQYLDVWERLHPGEPGHTFTTSNPLTIEEADWSRIPPRRIDYILVRCDDRGPTLRVEDCRLLFDQPVERAWASDHFGLTADLAGAG
jgi:endonuclease/exonuclease/phosphatase family metal-dependent hydrolase